MDGLSLGLAFWEHGDGLMAGKDGSVRSGMLKAVPCRYPSPLPMSPGESVTFLLIGLRTATTALYGPELLGLQCLWVTVRYQGMFVRVHENNIHCTPGLCLVYLLQFPVFLIAACSAVE